MLLLLKHNGKKRLFIYTHTMSRKGTREACDIGIFGKFLLYDESQTMQLSKPAGRDIHMFNIYSEGGGGGN
jgi:hypothetical protein